MKYLLAEEDLGTAGSVKNAEDFYRDERVLVISGDVLTDFDLTAAIAYHEEKGAAATMVLTRLENPLAYGVVITDQEGRISRFLEKPTWGEVFSDTINTGIYILEPEVFKRIPQGRVLRFFAESIPEDAGGWRETLWIYRGRLLARHRQSVRVPQSAYRRSERRRSN